MSQILQHKHVIFRIEAQNILLESDEEVLRNWTLNLIKSIGMEVMVGPILKWLDDPGNVGWTSACIIKTSHVVCHTWDTGLIQLDIYTCGSLDLNDVFQAVQFFKPTKIEYKFLDRELGLTLLDEGLL